MRKKVRRADAMNIGPAPKQSNTRPSNTQIVRVKEPKISGQPDRGRSA